MVDGIQALFHHKSFILATEQLSEPRVPSSVPYNWLIGIRVFPSPYYKRRKILSVDLWEEEGGMEMEGGHMEFQWIKAN